MVTKKISNTWKFVKIGKFEYQNRKNLEKDVFNFLIISPIFDELLIQIIPHSKAFTKSFDLFESKLALGVTVLGL